MLIIFRPSWVEERNPRLPMTTPDANVGFHFVPLPCGKLTQRGSKLQPNLQKLITNL